MHESLLGDDDRGASTAAALGAATAEAAPRDRRGSTESARASGGGGAATPYERARATAAAARASADELSSQDASLEKIRRENGACCSACVPSVIRVTWQLQVIGFFTALHASIDGDLSTPYYWSRVSCCGALGSPSELSATYDITCEDPPDDCMTAEYDPALDQPGDALGACDLPTLDRANPLWSHSNHCVNWDFVRFFVQRFVGIRSPIVTTVACLILPVGAGLADMYGRRPVIIFGAVATIMQLGLYWIASLPNVIEADRFGLLVYTGAIVNALGASTGSASNAMLADLVQPSDRAKGFPLLAMVGGMGPILGYAIAFTLLSMYIADYQWVWLVATTSGMLLLLFNVVLLPESLPTSMRKPFDWRDLNPVMFYVNAFKLLLPDPVILGLCATAWLIGVGLGGFLAVVYAQLLVGPLAWTQEIAILPGVAGAFAAVLFSCFAIGFNHRIGMWRAFFLGMTINVVAFAACESSSPCCCCCCCCCCC
jgi:MFS family permease